MIMLYFYNNVKTLYFVSSAHACRTRLAVTGTWFSLNAGVNILTPSLKCSQALISTQADRNTCSEIHTSTSANKYYFEQKPLIATTVNMLTFIHVMQCLHCMVH